MKRTLMGKKISEFHSKIVYDFNTRNHVQFYVFEKNIGVRESQNSNSRNHKTEIFIDNVPFTLHPLVGLLPNSTTSKELTIWPS